MQWKPPGQGDRRQPGPRELRRHPPAGVGRGGGATWARSREHLARHPARPDRGAAPLPARRVVLPYHGRGRHGLRPRRDDGPRPRDPGALRDASRPAPDDGGPCAGPSDPTRRTRAIRRGTGRARHGTASSWVARSPDRTGRGASARSAARRGSNAASGARTGGSTSRRGGQLPRVEVPAAAAQPRLTPCPSTTTSPTRSIPTSSGCGRPSATAFSTPAKAHLTLIGRESLGSWFEQALVARRQQHLRYRAEARVDVAPETYQQAAGHHDLLQPAQVPCARGDA
jgi:hypothetical protein